MPSALRATVRRIIERVMRPGLAPLHERLRGIAERLDRIEDRLDVGEDRSRKYRDELGWWDRLVKTDEGRATLAGPVDEVFMGWQRERLRELGRCLGLDDDAALDRWCAQQAAIEIGPGPMPALAAAPAWRRAVAVDPLARAYAERGLVPDVARHVTYLEAPGERIPLPSASADLVIMENALDHVADPVAVLDQVRRLLRPGGLLWMLVDLSDHRDHMHPHSFNEAKLRAMLGDAGLERMHERVSDHHSHPKARGEYRALLRRPGGGQP